MISENRDSRRELTIERCLVLNECIKQLQKVFTFDELDKNSFEKQYVELLEKVAEINYANYKALKKSDKDKKQHRVTNEIIDRHDKSSHGEQIMVNCLELDATLRTIYKGLYYDENEVEGFSNDYLYIIENAIETNWKTHVIGEEVSMEEFKRLVSRAN